MGIFGALTTAVTGMRAQSFALENISGNIANSQTTGFKREDTSFVDLIPDNTPTKQLAGNVIANSRSTNSVQGDIQNASVTTYMAINGQGFFVVEKPASFADNLPVFDGVDLYTRRGDFSTDKNGYLVNGAGYYLMGIPVDPTTGNLVGSVPQLLQFDSGFLPAQATTQIQYQANLASYPLTTAHDTGIPGSELLNPADYSVGHDPTVAGTGIVIANDLTTFLKNSISGGAITAYDTSGSPVNVQLRWAKTDSALYGGTDTWNLFYQTNSTATGTGVAWQNAGVDYKFAANGQMSPCGPARDAAQRDRRRRLARIRRAPAWLERSDAVRRRQRQRAGQRASAKRLSRRHAAIGVGQRQGPRGRHLFEQPHHRSREVVPVV